MNLSRVQCFQRYIGFQRTLCARPKRCGLDSSEPNESAPPWILLVSFITLGLSPLKRHLGGCGPQSDWRLILPWFEETPSVAERPARSWKSSRLRIFDVVIDLPHLPATRNMGCARSCLVLLQSFLRDITYSFNLCFFLYIMVAIT